MGTFKKFMYYVLSVAMVFTSCFAFFSLPASAAGVVPEDGNIYYIKNKNSGLYLQVEGDSSANGTNVCQATGTGSLGQKWIINQNSDGTFRLKSAVDMTGGVALDVPDGNPENLASIRVWSSNGLAPQNFKLADNNDGSYAILTQASNFARCLDVLNFSKESGADVIQYDCAMTINQLWYFEKASWPDSGSSSETTETTTESSNQSQSSTKSWNMGNSNFKNLGTISSTVKVDGLKLIATSAKTMAVNASTATLNGTTYNYCLALGGSGSTTYRAVALDVSGTSTIKVTAKSSGSDTRTLKFVNGSGTEVGTMSCTADVTLGSVKINGSGTIYIYSAGSGINIYKVQLDTTGALPDGSDSSGSNTTEGTTETTTSAVPSGNSVTVNNYADLVSNAKSMASKSGGGTIYVDAKSLDASEQLALNSTKGNPVAIIGVKQSDGTYPVLNYTTLRNNKVGSSAGSLKASSDDGVGVRISGSNYTVKNLIIEKAPDNGIQIKGSNAKNNTVENCIVRYNNDAGVQLTGGASYNTIKFVYSYRNCDVYTRGGNADGYAPKLGAAKGNTFYGCYAWDNSDDGWDSYDKTDGYTYDLSYEQCACWNNGNPDVFTGKYDYDKGNSLDTNLFLVQLISKQDSNYVSNYKNKKFALPTDSFINTDAGKISLSKWTGSNYDGNPNGFKFGSVNSGSNLTRTVKNCLAFNHGSKGFDNNNSSCTGSFQNCVSFDNGYNYYLPVFTLTKWTGIYGFSGKSNDKLPSGFSASTPDSSKQSSIRSKVNSTVNQIVNSCNSNKIPGEVYFNIY